MWLRCLCHNHSWVWSSSVYSDLHATFRWSCSEIWNVFLNGVGAARLVQIRCGKALYMYVMDGGEAHWRRRAAYLKSIRTWTEWLGSTTIDILPPSLAIFTSSNAAVSLSANRLKGKPNQGPCVSGEKTERNKGSKRNFFSLNKLVRRELNRFFSPPHMCRAVTMDRGKQPDPWSTSGTAYL